MIIIIITNSLTLGLYLLPKLILQSNLHIFQEKVNYKLQIA